MTRRHRLKVNKAEASRRQLETAIILYFDYGDPVSIHSLAAAAHQVLEDLYARNGGKTPMNATLVAHLPPALAQAIRAATRQPQNFFKHGNRDPDDLLEFTPELTEVVLLDAIMTYGRLTNDIPWLFDAFAKWFGLHHPSWYGGVPAWEDLLESARQYLGPPDRRAFLRQYRESLDRVSPEAAG